MKIGNIMSVAVSLFIWAQTIIYYTDAAACMQYNVVWAECRNHTAFAATIFLIVGAINILNLSRIITEKQNAATKKATL